MMNISNVAAFALAVFSTVAIGCGGDKSSSSTGAAAAGPAAPGSTAAAAAPGAAGGKPGVIATCVKKTACTEYRNTIPDLSEELCTGMDGVFSKGATPCATDKLLGTCVPKATPDATTYWYGAPEEADVSKSVCEAIEGKWTVPGKQAAGTSSAAAAPATTGKAPRSVPATPARKKR